MPTAGNVIVLPSGAIGVPVSGKLAAYNAAGACDPCCGPPIPACCLLPPNDPANCVNDPACSTPPPAPPGTNDGGCCAQGSTCFRDLACNEQFQGSWTVTVTVPKVGGFPSSNPTQTTGGAWNDPAKFLTWTSIDNNGNPLEFVGTFEGRAGSFDSCDPTTKVWLNDNLGGDCNGLSSVSPPFPCGYASWSYHKVTCHNPPRVADFSGSAFNPCVFGC